MKKLTPITQESSSILKEFNIEDEGNIQPRVKDKMKNISTRPRVQNVTYG